MLLEARLLAEFGIDRNGPQIATALIVLDDCGCNQLYQVDCNKRDECEKCTTGSNPFLEQLL